MQLEDDSPTSEAIEILRRQRGTQVVAVVTSPESANDLRRQAGVDLLAFPVGSNRTRGGNSEAIAALEGLDRPIDLLYLNGWSTTTAGYKEQHHSAYQAARDKLHEQSLVLIDGTDVDHGGKGTLVVTEALADGFRILGWGRATLLGKSGCPEYSICSPDSIPPVPEKATFEDAVRAHQNGRTWEAEQIYRHLLRNQPAHAGAMHLLGVVCQQLGQVETARELISRAIESDPTKAIYFNNYGATLQMLGRYAEAIACFHRALQIKPQYADAYSNLGLVLGLLGHRPLAAESFQMALQVEPFHRDTLERFARFLLHNNKKNEAVQLYRHAVEMNPDPLLAVKFADLLASAEDLEGAEAQYLWAIERAPDLPAASFRLGVFYHDHDRTAEGRARMETAVRRQPDKPLWRLKSLSSCPAVFRSTEEIDEFRMALCDVLDEFCENPPPAEWDELSAVAAFPNLSYSYHGRNNRPLKERFARYYQHYFQAQPEPPGSGLCGRWRIGVVVTARHEGVFLRCMTGILQQLDCRRFEIVILASSDIVDILQKRIGRSDFKYVGFPNALPEAVRTIRDTRCDLIYHWEICSDSLNYFLPFARLAPRQCTSHGCQVTSGNPAVDYFFTSDLMEKPEAQEHYAERLWRSRTLLMCQDRLSAPSPVSRAHFGLSDNHNLYVCFQNPMKVHPEFDPLLGEILRSDRNGRVVLLAGRFEHPAKLLRGRFSDTIPDVANQIEFLPWQSFEDYCRLLQLADVVLDPIHFGAGSSSYDVFSFNQPTVTLPGEFIVGRVAYAFYRKMGFEDLVAVSREDYVQKALRLGTDTGHRAAMRAKLASVSDIIFNDVDAVREHERFFEEILTSKT